MLLNYKQEVRKMKEIIEDLWSEYLIEKCAVITTDKERELTKKAAELHKKVNELLNKAQLDAVQEYVDTVYDINALFTKKAFCKGCEFAISFFLEAGNYKK